MLGEFKPMFDRRQYRQFCRYMTASWVSPTISVAHLNEIWAEHMKTSKKLKSEFSVKEKGRNQ